MKILFILIMTFILTSCTSNKTDKDTHIHPQNGKNETKVSYKPDENGYYDIYTFHQMKNNESYKSPREIIPKDETTYVNEEAGYKITFPEYWKNNFIIHEYGPGEICIGFYGKSETSKSYFKKLGEKRKVNDGFESRSGKSGLDIGWIIDCKLSEGCIMYGELGNINDKNYYITSAMGGAYLPIFDDVLKREKDKISKEEQKLIEEDSPIAVQMRDDLYNMNFDMEIIKGEGTIDFKKMN